MKYKRLVFYITLGIIGLLVGAFITFNGLFFTKVLQHTF